MMFRYDHDMGGWDYAWMSLGMLIFWVLLFAALALLIRFTLTGATPQFTQSSPTAEDLLAQRFARGEVDKDEYLATLATLRGRKV
ncbi:SHOCT domain-containing protein [Nocardia sp. SYP-A9097]|uniref:SHOCT domain-containing protein n=1 Tax=Nocardia sp. SYP-A9097 TaxID=2663237 RepID=UPI00129B1D78|nr:SHOCT domain-containing protein [Nocardia sp. SYP-A9097]MRH87632.1 SHOCT domain-containing protein [Nocardia sp. SYP-A9097]